MSLSVQRAFGLIFRPHFDVKCCSPKQPRKVMDQIRQALGHQRGNQIEPIEPESNHVVYFPRTLFFLLELSHKVSSGANV